MIVLVTGGRTYGECYSATEKSVKRAVEEQIFLINTLDAITKEVNITLLVHGGASGADRWANVWAHGRNLMTNAYPVDHDLDGPWPGAGPRRNQRMLTASIPDLVVAFPGGRGTADMMRRALRSLVELRVYKLSDLS